MALSTLLWAIPVFFVTGIVVGIVLQLVMPDYERGCSQVVWLALISVLAVVLVAVLMGVVTSLDPEPATDVRLRRTPLRILLAPFVLGALIGRLAKRKGRVQRRRRVVAPAGSHHVPTDIRATTDGPAPATDPVPTDRSLPTPFGPGGRDMASPPQSDGPLLPPQSSPPPPPPPPDPPTATGF